MSNLTWTTQDLESAFNKKPETVVKTQFEGVGTDTREDLTNKIFIALRGDRFDAHDFVDKALAQGATALILDKPEVAKSYSGKATIFLVDDTLQALQQMSTYWREKNNFKVLGITGSNGKTTTKEFAATLISESFKTSYSKGSFNNHWGLPLSLLASPSDSEVVIVEMGMNHKGEIERLCKIAKPDVVVVTQVGTAHIGELGSQEAIAEAKEEIYIHAPQALKIFNIENEFTHKMHEKHQQKNSLTFASHVDSADIKLRVGSIEPGFVIVQGHIQAVEGSEKVPVFGRHNVTNLMAASALALSVGISPDLIWKRLSKCSTIWGRNQIIDLKSGALCLFDGYNANPDSVSILIKNIFEMEPQGKRFFVLGEMGELGKKRHEFHQQIGALLAKSMMDWVYFIGESYKDVEKGVKSVSSSCEFVGSEKFDKDIVQSLVAKLEKNDLVVVKGSRFMKMEQVVESLNPINFSSKK
ncbi:MAG: UDP-N-acetylmuramoyl-tripeptide--D-alanyl-D-alanine ligase [Bdellovibrionales bacterium]|nr:UDP-N-acetylmuramoyl-tripeptide--D-alanyl-D-alanine ligase [Bdellovibrionales bacterium]